MDKFEVIKNFLLDESVSPEIRKERFEIAWDIKENLDKIIKDKLSLEKVIKPLKEKVEQYLNNYVVSKFDYGSIYITKPYWKESQNDRGIVAIAVELEKDHLTIGLVKNTGSKLPLENEVRKLLEQKYGLRTTHSWWLGYLPDERKPTTTKLPLKEYYLQILLNSEKVVEEQFLALKEVLDIANDKEISQLLEKIVKAKKEQTS